jgi:hypothetical protein
MTRRKPVPGPVYAIGVATGKSSATAHGSEGKQARGIATGNNAAAEQEKTRELIVAEQEKTRQMLAAALTQAADTSPRSAAKKKLADENHPLMRGLDQLHAKGNGPYPTAAVAYRVITRLPGTWGNGCSLPTFTRILKDRCPGLDARAALFYLWQQSQSKSS